MRKVFAAPPPRSVRRGLDSGQRAAPGSATTRTWLFQALASGLVGPISARKQSPAFTIQVACFKPSTGGQHFIGFRAGGKPPRCVRPGHCRWRLLGDHLPDAAVGESGWPFGVRRLDGFTALLISLDGLAQALGVSSTPEIQSGVEPPHSKADPPLTPARITRTSRAEGTTGNLNCGLARASSSSWGQGRWRVFSQNSLTCLPAGRSRRWPGCWSGGRLSFGS